MRGRWELSDAQWQLIEPRWEYHVENFFGMVRLGCMKILFRYL